MSMPDPPVDDLDDLLESPPSVALVAPSEAAQILDPLRSQLAQLVAGFAANRIRMTDPKQRADLVALRSVVSDVLEPLSLIKTTVERVFLLHAIDTSAREIPVPGGPAVVYEPPKGEYVGEWTDMRRELLAVAALEDVPGMRAEIAAAFTETVTVKGNNTKLNALAKKYGGKVRDVIEARRTFVMPDADRGRVRFPEARR